MNNNILSVDKKECKKIVSFLHSLVKDKPPLAGFLSEYHPER